MIDIFIPAGGVFVGYWLGVLGNFIDGIEMTDGDVSRLVVIFIILVIYLFSTLPNGETIDRWYLESCDMKSLLVQCNESVFGT